MGHDTMAYTNDVTWKVGWWNANKNVEAAPQRPHHQADGPHAHLVLGQRRAVDVGHRGLYFRVRRFSLSSFQFRVLTLRDVCSLSRGPDRIMFRVQGSETCAARYPVFGTRTRGERGRLVPYGDVMRGKMWRGVQLSIKQKEALRYSGIYELTKLLIQLYLGGRGD